jgi:hypothetical protein
MIKIGSRSCYCLARKIEKIKRGGIHLDEARGHFGRPSILARQLELDLLAKDLDGLDVFYISKLGRALLLRWPWYAWTDPEKPWNGMPLPCDLIDMELFRASADITISDGDKWLFGVIDRCQEVPSSFSRGAIKITTCKSRMVQRDFKITPGFGILAGSPHRLNSYSSSPYRRPRMRFT